MQANINLHHSLHQPHSPLKMASSTRVKVVERCSVSAPPHSGLQASHPLTFFDIPWLLFPPSQPLFFYNSPETSTVHFIQSILPNLKRSLSLTLQQFFPIAGKLLTPPSPATKPHFEYSDDDAVFLTVAEAASAGDFNTLAGNHRRMAVDFHGLVPELRARFDSKQPLLAVQITVFPEVGICIGFTLRHVAADGRTFNNFLKTWASFSKNGGILRVDPPVAFYDRSVIRDPSGLESTFLKEWWFVKNTQKEATVEANGGSTYDMIRATFVLGPQEMDKIKKWILTRADTLSGSTQLYLSPYVIVCAFIWTCWIKAYWSVNYQGYGDQIVHYFGFIAGGLTRLRYRVPDNYVGNCVGFGRASATKSDLIGKNGVIYAAKAIGNTIKRLNEDLFDGAKNWISEWKAMRESELHVTVTGSPKVGLYGLDFGWGRPVKIEEVSIDTTSAISLCEGREVVGSIEIGVALPKSKMDAFCTLFSEGLKQYTFVNGS